MLGRLLPQRLKAYLKAEFRWLTKASLPEIRADLMSQSEGYFPHEPGSATFVIPKLPPPGLTVPGNNLPVPDADLRGEYGSTPEEYLRSGQRDVQTMREIVGKAGPAVEALGRILDFGCSSGRMIRWLGDIAKAEEVWGTDIRSSRIIWCRQYLSPPFHFAVSTLVPHLPFEDRYFGFIYAGSVFTHIDDLAPTWFLELRRILRPGGRLYITIHDRKTVALLAATAGRPGAKLANAMRELPAYQEYVHSDYGMFTIGRSLDSLAFYDADYLARSLAPFYRVLSVTEEAYGYQAAMLLERVGNK